MNVQFKYVIILIICGLNIQLNGQKESSDFRKYDFFPAVSYAPENGLTLGVIGYRYFQTKRPDQAYSRNSNINFLAVYTTKQQIIAESTWDIFFKDNKFRSKGFLAITKFPDRNYGLGNDAGLLLEEFDFSEEPENFSETRNYLSFSINRVTLRSSLLKRLGHHSFAGIFIEMENESGYERVADSISVTDQADEIFITEITNEGFRAGLGANFIYDTRDQLINPLKGTYIDLVGVVYNEIFLSEYDYSYVRLDLRQFLNPVYNHTLALRSVLNFTASESFNIPTHALARVGGQSFNRGYFAGTYQDKHMLSFEAEYRLPFWNNDITAPWYHIWERLGVVVFASTSQVYGYANDFEFANFNSAVGAGLRILLNQEQRVNLRVDYAYALAENSNGPGMKQTGLYFYLGEAF